MGKVVKVFSQVFGYSAGSIFLPGLMGDSQFSWDVPLGLLRHH